MSLFERIRVCFLSGWQRTPPDEPGFYWMRTKGRWFYGLPVMTESVPWGVGAVRQLDLLTKPRRDRKWRRCG